MTIGMVNCMKCGNPNVGGAQFCSGCGSQLGFQPVNPQSNSNGRAVAALVLGIAGLLMCGPLTAIPGAIMAWMEMQAVREGRAPQSNNGMAKVALWINVIAIVLTGLFCLVFGFFGMLIPTSYGY